VAARKEVPAGAEGRTRLWDGAWGGGGMALYLLSKRGRWDRDRNRERRNTRTRRMRARNSSGHIYAEVASQ
jgi:hypothetical protein